MFKLIFIRNFLFNILLFLFIYMYNYINLFCIYMLLDYLSVNVFKILMKILVKRV